jgi:hypothetical protein
MVRPWRISEGRAKIEQQKFNDKLDAVVAGVQVAPRFKTSLTNYFRSTPPPPNILFASTITNIFSPPSHFDATTMPGPRPSDYTNKDSIPLSLGMFAFKAAPTPLRLVSGLRPALGMHALPSTVL